MDNKRPHFPLDAADDSLSGVASSCDMTGLEPTPPKTQSEADSYSALAGVPSDSAHGSPESRRARRPLQ